MSTIFEQISGFRRADGRFGVRNRVLVMAAADNINPLAEAIARAVPGSTYIPATFGRGQLGEDLEVTLRTQANMAAHPNVFGALIVSFEPESAERIASRVNSAGRQAHCLSLLEEGGHYAALASGVATVSKLMREATQLRPEAMPLSSLVIGLKCGGSDATSGLVANPAMGLVSDALVQAGATLVFSEPVELIGCDAIFKSRASSEVAQRISQSVQHYLNIAKDAGVDLVGVNPTADNIAGGLTTIEEKSLGALAKTGSAPITGVVDYGETVTKPGLWFMDAPAAAVENITALAAGGCQAILFSSGSVNPCGHPIAPTLKICANPHSRTRMAEHIDVDLSDVLEDKADMEAAKERILEQLYLTLLGGDTKADILGYTDTRISKIGLSV